MHVLIRTSKRRCILIMGKKNTQSFIHLCLRPFHEIKIDELAIHIAECAVHSYDFRCAPTWTW
jgi:hypothetical protein